METGRVIGVVWATKKTASTAGLRWLLVQGEDGDENPEASLWVAADTLDAGVGDRVVLVFGRAARISTDHMNTSIECATIGVIDDTEIDPELLEQAHLAERLADQLEE